MTKIQHNKKLQSIKRKSLIATLCLSAGILLSNDPCFSGKTKQTARPTISDSNEDTLSNSRQISHKRKRSNAFDASSQKSMSKKRQCTLYHPDSEEQRFYRQQYYASFLLGGGVGAYFGGPTGFFLGGVAGCALNYANNNLPD